MTDFGGEKLKDEELALVSGGDGVNYSIQDDPLYKKFSEILKHENKDKVTGMDTRAGFIDEFQAWVKEGSPENIRGWYQDFKKKVFS